MRSTTASDIVRRALIAWREIEGDRQAALEAWTGELAERYGPDATLVARLDDMFGANVEIEGHPVTALFAFAEAVAEIRGSAFPRKRLWSGVR
jgi:hypothetical protein